MRTTAPSPSPTNATLTTEPTSDAYVACLLAAYRRTPGTLGSARAADRRLAAALHKRGVPIAIAHAALTLAAARRAKRAGDASSLAPIRSLHYFLPVIAELRAHPPDPAYIEYLERTMARRPKPAPPPPSAPA